MNVLISVRTADGVPIVGATVGLNGGGTTVTTDTNGGAALAPTGDSFTVTATMANYSEQATSFAVAQDGSLIWDDPGTIVTDSGGQPNIEMRLGRLVPSPTVAMDQKALDDILKFPDNLFNKKHPENPSYAVPLQHTFTLEDGEYAFLSAGEKQFWAALRITILADNGKGWGGALDGTQTSITPNMQGKFTWLEWGPPGGSPAALNRYLVGLWRPRSSSVPGSAPRDAIIFYTPYTDTVANFLRDTPPYRKNYPYALNQDYYDPHKLMQRYVALGLRYIFYEKFLAYQLLAAARDALLIVPIQPSGNWEVFQRAEGIQRLLKEVILFEHRQRLSSDDDPSLDTAPVGTGTGEAKSLTQHLPPPPLGTIVTAGFSAGMKAVKQQIINEIISYGHRPAARTWANESKDSNSSYYADPTEFFTSWREIWDLDGDMDSIGNYLQWGKTLADWQRFKGSGHYVDKDSDRIARCYHTDFTGWTAETVTKMDSILTIAGPVPGTHTSPIRGASPKAAERNGTNGSAVWFSKRYLEGNGPSDTWNEETDAPAFWEKYQHQAVPAICFAHAAVLSQLRKL